ncbi:hypothetical protein [Candidatus Formimonas warabiya]|uniref:Uncharacterized protein n=1 Tax=Formimonas warabiya TaxID=1761012 RepID=A0A3G1KPW8_FORW1|nr:hypothetical protein [Candidatus Formimonas warabiya]ATW24504.1 hypothetical protein DCMF_06665 [Candidatus Formimonas warabiya]
MKEASTEAGHSLNSLLNLYSLLQTKIEFYQKKADDDPVKFLPMVILLLGTDILCVNKLFEAEMVFFVIPLFSMMAHYRFSFYSRFVAILRGYSAYLEGEINKLSGENYFMWNAKYISEFISPHKFRTNRVSDPVLNLFLLLPNIYSFYRMFCAFTGENFLFLGVILVYLLFYIVFTSLMTYETIQNGAMRRKAAEYPAQFAKAYSLDGVEK